MQETRHASRMQVTVNGEPRDIPVAATLLDLLRLLKLDARAIVVEHNREIVRRPSLGAVRLNPGDAVELVHFVGGG